jgi:6-phosphofructokinase 1
LVTIGGDGTYMGALKLTEMGINCIGLPGTIDNNVVSSQFTIGFDTALNTIVNAIDNIRDTSSSHHRCSIIECMGQNCGDLALFAGLATGAELISTPENKKTEKEILDALLLAKKQNKRHCMIVVAEHLYDVKVLEKMIKEKTE